MIHQLKDINFKSPTNLEFIKRLSTPTGILQHTTFAVPDRFHGYCSDDNARALLLMARDFQLFKKHQALNLALTYLAYLAHSKTPDNFFYTYQTFDHQFKPDVSEDAFGRVIWSLGYTVFADLRWDITGEAEHLFNQVQGNFLKLKHPRAICYTLLGCIYFQQSKSKNDKLEEITSDLIEKIALIYQKTATPEWSWFEETMTYSNGLFPLAMFKAFQYFKNDTYLRIAVESLGFLESQSKVAGYPAPIGSDGWLKKGAERALWDQQPLDAAMMVLANSEAYRILGKDNYKESALNWFSWFHGNNLKQKSLYDKNNGGCFDGLIEDGVNLNQGAESALVYWLSYLELVDLLKEKK